MRSICIAGVIVVGLAIAATPLAQGGRGGAQGPQVVSPQVNGTYATDHVSRGLAAEERVHRLAVRELLANLPSVLAVGHEDERSLIGHRSGRE